MRKITVLILAIWLAAPACTRVSDGTRPGMSLGYDAFIQVMVELKQSTPDQKAVILKKHKTTEAEMRAFVATHARNPALLSAVFDSIQARIDRKTQTGE